MGQGEILSQLFQLFRVMGFGVEGQIRVQFVEQKDVHAPYPVALVKAKHALLVNALKSFKVSTVYRCPERQGHSFIKLNLREDKLTYLHSN